MTDINFLYWLRGLLETKQREMLSEADVHLIKQHLALITCKEMQATVFIEGILMGLELSYDRTPSLSLTTTLNNIISGVIQEVAEDKKDEKVIASRAAVSRGNGLSRGFHGGTTYC